MNIADLILLGGQDSAAAVHHGDAVLTYAELRDCVARLAGGLLERVHRKGERVGIYSENSPFFVKAYLGIIRAGLVAVPFQTDLTEEAFGTIVVDAGINEVFVSKGLLKRAQPWACKLGVTLLPENQENKLTGKPFSRTPPVNTTL